ncbi:MAG: hypothetical protein WA869_23100 [Alloacidobacterium sp.]
MQNRYVGDVGDYGKYALLRQLCGSDKCRFIRLAVVWCLFPDETFNNDGKHISYLRSREFVDLDPDLYKALNSIVSLGRRHVSSIAELGCLPRSTVFFTQLVSVPEDLRAGRIQRVRHRDDWLRECLCQTQDCELVFFDPDNGLEVASVPKHHPKAGKYIYWNELVPFWNRGNTLLIYHHLNRTAPAALQINSLKLRFASVFDRAAIVPLVFRRGSSRVFWLVHRSDVLGQELEQRAAHLLNTGWSRHFRPFGWPSDDQASTVAR